MIKTLCIALTLAMATTAYAAEPFRFEAETSLDDMTLLVRGQFSGASTRDQVRAVFVGEGGATLIAHPRRANVEKYLYDINLCSYYVWRWNISADYAHNGTLKQIYVNGAPVLQGARRADLPMKGPFYALARARPQAFKGESTLTAIVADRDRDPKTTEDMMIMTGLGPTRADPLDMGRAINNPGEVWRSIFDLDDARTIATYAGDCAAVDAALEKRRGSGRP
jgi:hypothetical protein